MTRTVREAAAAWFLGSRTVFPDGLPLPQRYWAMAAVMIGITLSVLDGAIANVALPTIATELAVSPADSIWVVNAYQLAIVVCLLPMAFLGEVAGYRRVYLWGVVLFTTASLACALSHSLAALTAARVVQGFGAAGIMSVNAALVRFTYPAAVLGRGIGYNAVVVGVAAALGPTVAAGILSVLNWPWLFAVNVPLGLFTLLLGSAALPRNPLSSTPFDILGAVLSALTIGLFITAIDAGGHGGGIAAVGGELAAALITGTLLVRGQLRRRAPLLPLDLFRIPIFSLSIATSITSFAAQTLAYVSLPFMFQNVTGNSQVEIGLLMTPWPLATAIVAPIAGRLSDRYPAGLLGAIGLATFGGGLVLLALLPAHPAFADIAWRMALCGVGFGTFQSPNNKTIIGSAPRSRSGSAGGMLATARLLGQTSGAALVALVFGRVDALGAVGMHGAQVALWLGAGASVLAATASSLRLLRFDPPAASG